MVRRVHLSLSDPRFTEPDWIDDLAAKIEQRLPRRIDFTPETARILPPALRAYARHERLGTFWLEGELLNTVAPLRTELLASGKCLDALRAGYDMLAATRPHTLVILRKGSHVIRRSDRPKE